MFIATHFKSPTQTGLLNNDSISGPTLGKLAMRFEPSRQRLRGFGKQKHIDADGDELRALREIARRYRFVSRQQPRRLAIGEDAADRPLHRRDHLRMLRLTDIAQRRRKIGCAQEY